MISPSVSRWLYLSLLQEKNMCDLIRSCVGRFKLGAVLEL